MKTIAWRQQHISYMILGTAQIGMNYGLANQDGKPSRTLSTQLIRQARRLGVNAFDTAPDYGNAENILGQTINTLKDTSPAYFFTKLSPSVPDDDENAIQNAVENSRRNLHAKQLFCLMLHRHASQRQWDGTLGKTLNALKKQGAVQHLGASVYSVDEAMEALDNPDLEIIQIPCNIWDRRMKQHGVLERARKLDKLCVVRSALLQGLLTMSPRQAAQKLPAAKNASERWNRVAEQMATPTTSLAIRYAISLNAPLVVGVDNLDQLEEMAGLIQREPPLTKQNIDRVADAVDPALDPNLTDPRKWTKLT